LPLVSVLPSQGSSCRAFNETDGRPLSLGAPMAHEINTALFYWSVKQQLPMAHPPDVDVHEVRVAVVPHSSAMQAQGCVTQLRRGNPTQANVDRFGLHM
jgi:hypothetical protein